jgi:hypothetical protein
MALEIMRLCFEEFLRTDGGPRSLEVEGVCAPSPPKTLLSAVVSGALDAVKAVIAHMERRASTDIFLNFGLGCCRMRADMARKFFSWVVEIFANVVLEYAN